MEAEVILDKIPVTRLKVIPDAALTQIHEATIRLLGQTGIKFYHEGALKIFKKHGAKLDKNIVYIPRKMVEDAIESAPRKFKWSGRNEKQTITIENNFPYFKTACSRGMTSVYDLEGGVRRGTLKDHINATKIYHSSDACDISGGYATDAAELSIHDKHLILLKEVLKNTDKPFHVSTGNKPGHISQVLDIIEIVVGRDNLGKNHYACATGSPLSPLAFSEQMTEAIIQFATRNQIVNISSCSIGGVSSPINLIGQTVLENTEIIAGLVLSQLVKPQAPVIMEPTGTTGYLKTAAYIGGTPECMLRTIPSIQMALDLYNLPVRTISGMSDSKLVDAQAGLESMQNTLLLALSGCSILDCALGSIESLYTTAFEKIIIDEEIINRCRCICEGIDVSEDAFSLDIIQECAHDSGKYISHQSTLNHFRERWLPSISDCENRLEWELRGSKDIARKANEEYKRRILEAKEAYLEEEVEKELDDYIEKAIRLNIDCN